MVHSPSTISWGHGQGRDHEKQNEEFSTNTPETIVEPDLEYKGFEMSGERKGIKYCRRLSNFNGCKPCECQSCYLIESIVWTYLSWEEVFVLEKKPPGPEGKKCGTYIKFQRHLLRTISRKYEENKNLTSDSDKEKFLAFKDNIALIFFHLFQNPTLPFKERTAALEGLALIDTPTAFSALKSAIVDQSFLVRLEVVTLLGGLSLSLTSRGDEAVSALGSIIGDSREFYLVRIKAVECLVGTGKHDSIVEYLLPYISDLDPDVGEACRTALKTLNIDDIQN